jgi:hypothetical protein
MTVTNGRITCSYGFNIEEFYLLTLRTKGGEFIDNLYNQEMFKK